jgi:hypothetical protein
MQWGNVVSWILIVAGWAVINAQNNSRETRKEIRAALLDLYELLDEIEDDAFSYHTGTTGDAALARKIKRNISQISTRIKLALRDKLECEYARPLVAFRKSITLSNFDSNKFLSKSADSKFFNDISDAKQSLIVVLDRAFNAKFK